ncbi:class I SAM-dependent methyltransferase [Albibacterium bauzanense]|uniref:SAM-dependent MidA family methyltransferase n=1 Tax=Albibacterium bauzanense TaxID=653929 RepID=A0A4R1M298_9SPHI|nr:SAM-dependent methyltransferase [Albibacterium bauzanense]TCK84964.1 SAM-dependent MidA family methyltransferase [Albibacterium bauzanense]
MGLTEIIQQKIKDEGVISFEEFMEMCLYYPELGYYTSPGNKIGMNGDFYTSAYLTPVFGALIGKQLEEMWKTLGCTDFTIVEYGAGTGMLCHDILSYLKKNEKMYEQLKYYIIEKSPIMREIEKSHLLEKVEWLNSINELPEVNGCIFSNELVDNFAVHQVVMKNELMEVFVSYDNGFTEVLQPAQEELKEYLKELNIELPKDFRSEINLQAINWIQEIASSLNQGYVMTIDYGYLSSELYKPYRSQGTLMCYNNHKVNDNLYDNIGIQDITSHVNFSALINSGRKSGLNDCAFTSQCDFLLSMGFTELIQQMITHEDDVIQAARKISFLNHTLLIDMGSKFKFLIQKKQHPL